MMCHHDSADKFSGLAKTKTKYKSVIAHAALPVSLE